MMSRNSLNNPIHFGISATSSILILMTTLSTSILSGCNERVFKKVDLSCNNTITEDIAVPTAKAADILIVIDNSASMQEEQNNLQRNFFDPNCPITNLDNIPEQYKNPSPVEVQQLAANCGFIQLLAAFENDFHVGVITTDLGMCDNRQAGNTPPGGPADWGRHPQRGCLQHPSDTALPRVISRADLSNDDANVRDIGTRFTETLARIKTYGSPVERGLDAAKIFLDPSANKHSECGDDLNDFLRDDAKLVIIFLTDEEDCSHNDGELNASFDENANDPSNDDGICVAYPPFYSTNNPKKCYDANQANSLVAVDNYVNFFKSVKSNPDDVSVAVIAGGLRNEAGSIEPGSCTTGGDGQPLGACWPSGGLSNRTAPGFECAADTAAARGGLPCCQADSGDRYFELASSMGTGRALTDSICYSEFRKTMVDIARFIARVEFIQLAEPVANPQAISVLLTKAGSDTPQILQALDAGADCTANDGWQLQGDRRINFCGDSVPGPGDNLSVRALGKTSEQGDTCVID